MSMSEREPSHEARLEELARMLANHPFVGMAVDEINGLEAEGAELRQEIERLRQGYGKEFMDIEAELAPALGYTWEEGYGWNTGDHTQVTLAAELRERVGALEGALKFTDDWFKETRGDSSFNPMPPGAYQVHEIVHTALSPANAQAKLETRSEEQHEENG